jgi:hypothetical protein
VSDRKLFGGSPVGAVTIVEAPVSQWYIRRARIAFLGMSVVSCAIAVADLAMFLPLILAIPLAVLAGVVCGFVIAVLVRIWPVLRALWWWSLEITVSAFLVFGSAILGRATRPHLAVVALLLAAGGCAVVGPVRRALVAGWWCLVVRHRLRLCFARLIRGTAMPGSRPGLLPLVLWARPTPAGERVWLWLRPGLELADLDDKCGRIAVACWAKQVRVLSASERFAALLRIDVYRRDPLAGRIDSPLALLIPSLGTNNKAVPVSPAMPPSGLELAEVAEPAPEPASRGGRR